VGIVKGEGIVLDKEIVYPEKKEEIRNKVD